MRLHNLLRGMVCIVPLALAACGGDPTPFNLELIVNDCAHGNTPVSSLLFSGGDHVKVTISGDGMSDVSAQTPRGSTGRSLDLPEIPIGKNRVARVEVRQANEDGNLVAIGASAPFEVSENDTPKVTVVLYRVNGYAFTRADGSGCSLLHEGRAGHTATLLQDGRVLIAGGFSFDNENGKSFLDSAEIFDPVRGTFQEAGSLCEGSDCIAVAHAKSARLRDGRVLIVGGEGEDGAVSARTAIFDPNELSWTLGPDLEFGRRGHTATPIEASGGVLIVGGVDAEGQIIPKVEIFEPSSNSFRTATIFEMPRAFHTAAPAGNRGLQIVGGIDAEGLLPTTSTIILWTQGSDTYSFGSSSESLTVGSMGGGLVAFGGNSFALVGGAKAWAPESGSPGLGSPSSYAREAQWFHGSDTREKGVGMMPRARLNPCVAPLDAKRALVVGGFGESDNPLGNSDVLALVPAETGSDTQEKLEVAQSQSSGSLREAAGRGFGSCTALGDGRVLLIGGLNNDGTTTRSAEIFIAQQARAAN